jgi:pyruvate formate lyase activating enzyme
LYCHNADTWGIRSKKHILTPEEALAEIMKVKGFIKSGGVTVSGGEPLLQPDFVLELFKLCKKEGIHTAVDTSGYVLNDRVKKVLEYTDLVLLDIKQINPERYKILTSVPLQPTLDFVRYLSEIDMPTWVRYVLVPGFSDAEEDLHSWAKYVSQFSMIQRVDVLPFHQMGMHKWEEVGKEYKLKEVPTPSRHEVRKVEEIFRSYGLNVLG